MKRWFVWWIQKEYDGTWYGPMNQTDLEAYQEQVNVNANNIDVKKLYRWYWDGSNWIYDTRPDSELLAMKWQYNL